MTQEIYTREEQLLIYGAKAIQAKQDTAAALALDLLLLEMEDKMGLMDGLKKEDVVL